MADSLFNDLALLLSAPKGAEIHVGVLEGGAYALLQVEGEDDEVFPLAGGVGATALAWVRGAAMNDPWGPLGPWADVEGREWYFQGEVR